MVKERPGFQLFFAIKYYFISEMKYLPESVPSDVPSLEEIFTKEEKRRE